MPIVFDEGWNRLNLSKLNSADNIAMLWRARTKLRNEGLDRLTEYLLLIALNQEGTLNDTQKRFVRDLSKILGEKRKTETTKVIEGLVNKKTNEPILDPQGKQRTVTKTKTTSEQESAWFARTLDRQFDSIYSALKRDKVTNAILREFQIDGNHFKQGDGTLDNTLEAIHNDRLRITDREMLTQHSAAAITLALHAAKNKFNNDAKAAGLLNAVCSEAGEPVRVTQGVHQSNDPHFDVLMPGDQKQIHVNVRLPVAKGERISIRSISYIRGNGGAEETVTVVPD